MASYESAPDTQSYTNLRPYELPYNQLMQTVQAKTNYWLQGANQLKTAYQSAAGLDLSLDTNRSALRDFTTQANQQVNQAAKSDLSQADNVNNALHIFDPLYDGSSELSQNVMGDHAVTTRAKQIQSQFEEAKTKNNGKEYSPINEQYALSSYHDFLKNGNPKRWKEAYQNLKGYTPYYDYHKDISDALRNCRPSSSTQTGVNGMYLASSSTTTLSSAQAGACVGASLSPQAENQIAMEGYVKYGKNYQALANDYLPVALQNQHQLSTERAQLAGRLAKATDDPTRKQLSQQIGDYDKQLQNIQDSLDKYHNGDLSFFKNNYDVLAASTYRGQKLQAIGNAFQYSEQKNDLKADPVQMMFSNQRFQNQELTQKEAFDAAHLKEEYKLKWELEQAKKGVVNNPNAPFTPSITGNVTKKGTDDFNNDVLANHQATADNDLQLYNYLKNNPQYSELVADMKPPNQPNSPFSSFVDGLFKGKSPQEIANMDLPLNSYYTKKGDLEWKNALLTSTQQAVDTSPKVIANKNDIHSVIDQVSKPNSFIANSLDGSTHVPFSFSADQTKALLQGSLPGATLGKKVQYGQPGYGSIGTPVIFNTVKTPQGEFIVPPGSDLDKMVNARDIKVDNYDKTRDELFQQHYVSQYKYQDLSGVKDPPEHDLLASTLAPLLGHSKDTDSESAAMKDVTIMGARSDGTVRFRIGDISGKEPDDKDVMQQLAAAGFVGATKVPDSKGIWEVSHVPAYDKSNQANTIEKIQNFAENLYAIKRQGGDKYPRIAMPDYNGLQIAGIPDVNDPSHLIFEINNPHGANPNVRQYARTPSELAFFLQNVK